MSPTKVEHKAVYDLGKKELKNRTEIKLDSGIKVCCWPPGPSQGVPQQQSLQLLQPMPALS